MTDILVPAEPADLIDRIIALQLRLGVAPQGDLIRQHDLLSGLAARIMPDDAAMADLTLQLFSARSDIASLTHDLQACDARKDYGTAFVALSQSLLAAMTAIEGTKAAINAHYCTAYDNRLDV